MRSTALPRVRVIDTAFFVPQLQRLRRLWMYFPEGFYASKQPYPVLYLQDGQNMFDAHTSYAGDWGVDEAMEQLVPQFGACVVVGIDNGGDRRLNEYAPFNFVLHNHGRQLNITAEGSQYIDFLVHSLRPFLVTNFKASPLDQHHFIAGSSMGGLIAFYAALKYPQRWGGTGVFSPSFWLVKDALVASIATRSKRMDCPVYFYAGNEESEAMVPDMLAIIHAIEAHQKAEITTVIRNEGRHAEHQWRSEFPAFYEWMMNKLQTAQH